MCLPKHQGRRAKCIHSILRELAPRNLIIKTAHVGGETKNPSLFFFKQSFLNLHSIRDLFYHNPFKVILGVNLFQKMCGHSSGLPTTAEIAAVFNYSCFHLAQGHTNVIQLTRARDHIYYPHAVKIGVRPNVPH